jgi:hypothetical protein
MSGMSIPFEVLEAVITLAVLIAASGLLVFFASNRMGRTGDRARALRAEAEGLQMADASVEASSHPNAIKRKHIARS